MVIEKQVRDKTKMEAGCEDGEWSKLADET
jgi:hypothetical protein